MVLTTSLVLSNTGNGFGRQVILSENPGLFNFYFNSLNITFVCLFVCFFVSFQNKMRNWNGFLYENLKSLRTDIDKNLINVLYYNRPGDFLWSTNLSIKWFPTWQPISPPSAVLSDWSLHLKCPSTLTHFSPWKSFFSEAPYKLSPLSLTPAQENSAKSFNSLNIPLLSFNIVCMVVLLSNLCYKFPKPEALFIFETAITTLKLSLQFNWVNKCSIKSRKDGSFYFGEFKILISLTKEWINSRVTFLLL